MKVKEFIDALNAIGYDDNTELTFGFIDGYTGEWYQVKHQLSMAKKLLQQR